MNIFFIALGLILPGASYQVLGKEFISRYLATSTQQPVTFFIKVKKSAEYSVLSAEIV